MRVNFIDIFRAVIRLRSQHLSQESQSPMNKQAQQLTEEHPKSQALEKTIDFSSCKSSPLYSVANGAKACIDKCLIAPNQNNEDCSHHLFQATLFHYPKVYLSLLLFLRILVSVWRWILACIFFLRCCRC